MLPSIVLPLPWGGTLTLSSYGLLSLLGVVAGLLVSLRLAPKTGVTSGDLLDVAGRSLVGDAIELMIQLNVMLAFFNLVPVPPLDGSHLWPRAWTGAKEFAQRYSFILFILLFFVKLPGTARPLGWLVIGPMIERVTQWLLMLGGVA